ncbi:MULTISPECIES: hypothetical protein [unclassified Pseudomonas]|uniref:hypothetical protein n=1 Tax=unclassified Pseudomonas TaxID=196821 RepID=UPI00257A27EE|nr:MULTISPECIES: hypothetical protein [unclassified Pseudomonas]
MTLTDWLPKNSSELAAWIQAIGSIGAICVAVAIPAVTSAKQRKALEKERTERAKNTLIVLFPMLMDLSLSMTSFCERYDPANPDGKVLFGNDPDNGNFQRHAVRVMNSAATLNELPSSVAHSVRELIVDLIDLEHSMKTEPRSEPGEMFGMERKQLVHLRHQVLKVLETIRKTNTEVIEAFGA